MAFGFVTILVKASFNGNSGDVGGATLGNDIGLNDMLKTAIDASFAALSGEIDITLYVSVFAKVGLMTGDTEATFLVLRR